MYKLLPEEERVKVAHEYALRRAALWLIAFILIGAVALSGLLPSYLLTRARRDEVLARLSVVGAKEESAESVAAATWLKKARIELETLEPKLDSDRISVLFEEVIRDKPAGIRLTNISYNKSANKASFALSGVASDRQALLSFESILQDSEAFSDVALPVSNLAKDKDLSFQIKLMPKLKP